MENDEPNFREMEKDVAAYINIRLQMLRLNLYGKSAKISARASITIVGMMLGFFFLLFLATTLALIIGNWIHSLAGGFAIVTLIYLILFLAIVVFYRKKIEKNLIDRIIQLLTEDENE
jgi:cytochrome c biogenesis protein CcdA